MEDADERYLNKQAVIDRWIEIHGDPAEYLEEKYDNRKQGEKYGDREIFADRTAG